MAAKYVPVVKGWKKLGLWRCWVEECFTSQCRENTLWLIGIMVRITASRGNALTRPVVPDLGEW